MHVYINVNDVVLLNMKTFAKFSHINNSHRARLSASELLDVQGKFPCHKKTSYFHNANEKQREWAEGGEPEKADRDAYDGK